ncbi:sugar translocase [Caballeronia sp. SEWSISQ10-4 2]|uniref:sugar translocase n=1 Tax=Caballeronia sp. SEWSISQ10-4 2 TaxID=2937438 RepID=UPI00264ECC4C|nr:sugar translocase [Caballeronia sp. SEWSISQ10-4 2]MDN7181211.1 sugar translocase [Caballeronia sp. SEWSISQ10-4 2]
MTDFSENTPPLLKAKDAASTSVVCFALSIVAIFIGWSLVGGRHFDINVPFLYSGDGLLVLTLTKRVIENPWVFNSNLMGAPFGSSIYDYPIPDSGSLLVLKALGVTLGSAAAAFNVYYMLSFALNAVVAYVTLCAMRLSQLLSFAGGLVFTLLPFHFLRAGYGHLFYTWYFAAPAFTWLALRTYRGALDFFDHRTMASQGRDVLVLLALSCFGVYFAFFGVIAILSAGAMRFSRLGSLRSFRGAAVAAAIVVAGVAANVAPTVIYRMQHGANAETAQRSPVESEIYGLKIAQLLLPRPDHRFSPFARLNTKYSSTFPLVTENLTASLGIIGSVGFLALLMALFARTKTLDERFLILSVLTLVFVLVCSIGGFSALFALLVSPLIRAWNRASVFIAFFSVAASLMLIERAMARIKRTRTLNYATLASAIGLCVFAVWDQTTSACLPCLESSQASYRSDSVFVTSIERIVGKRGNIYQLPYVAFPEVPPVNGLQTYDQARGFLQSKTLGWSFGAIKGRQADIFFRALASEPLARQLEVTRRLGFAGVWIDRRGYQDAGRAIEADWSRALNGQVALVSPDGNQIFFNLIRPGEKTIAPSTSHSAQEIMRLSEDGVEIRK